MFVKKEGKIHDLCIDGMPLAKIKKNPFKTQKNTIHKNGMSVVGIFFSI